jgi:hypothetical protein
MVTRAVMIFYRSLPLELVELGAPFELKLGTWVFLGLKPIAW